MAARIETVGILLGFLLGSQTATVVGKQLVVLVKIVVLVLVEMGFGGGRHSSSQTWTTAISGKLVYGTGPTASMPFL